MEVVYKGFSVREYARKMRSVDLERCWPFSGEISRECMESLLPPITVARFRWWSHELSVLRANSQATDESKRRRAKAKSRAPKKRSIIEIFEASPQIHTINDEDGGGSDSEEVEISRDMVDNSSVRLTNFKVKKKKKMIENEETKKKLDVMEMLKQKKNIKKKKNKKKLEKIAKDGSIDKKVNKHKMHTRVKFGKKLDGTQCSPAKSEDVSILVSLCKRKAGLQHLSTPKKDKVVQSSKSFTKEQEIFRVRSILKKKTSVNPVENASSFNLKNADRLNPWNVQQKHVRFSDYSDILAQRKKNISCSPQSVCSLHSNALALSSGKDQCSESSRELSTIFVDQHNSDTPSNAAKVNMVQLVTVEEQPPHASDAADVQNLLNQHFSYHEKVKNPPTKSIFPSDVGICYDDFREVNDSVRNVSHRELSSGWKSTDYYVDHGHGFAATNSKGKAQVLPQHTSSGFTLNEIRNRTPFLPQPAPENMHPRTLQHQTFGYQSPMELIRSLCPFPEGKQKTDVYRERRMDDEFLGLPLNSQGELVQANGTCFGGSHQARGSGFTTGSSRSLPIEKNVGHFSNLKKHVTERALAKDHLDLFPIQKCRTEKLPMYIPARIGVDGTFSEKPDAVWENYYRGNQRTVHSLNSDLNLKNRSLNICKQKDQIQNGNGKGIIESEKYTNLRFLNNTPAKMRLMGKDVTVGKSSTEMQLFWARKIRSNEGIIAESCPISSSPSPVDDSSLKGHIQQGWLLPPTLGYSEKTQTQTTGNQWKKTLQSNTLMKYPVPRFLDPHGNWPTQLSRGLITDQNPRQTFLEVCPPHTSCPMLDQNFNFHGSVLPQANTLTLEPQPPLLFNPQTTSPHTDYSTANLNFNQVIPHERKTSLNFPFLHPDAPEHVFESSIPRFLHGTQQVKTSITPQLFPEAGGKYQASATVPNYFTTMYAHESPVINYPQDPMSSYSHARNSLGLASTNDFQLLGDFSGLNPAFGAKDVDNIKRTNKRQAAIAECPTKDPKMPKLQMEHGLEAVKELAPKILICNKHENAGPPDLRSDQANKVFCTQNEPPGDELRASPGTKFCRNSTREGPIKLSSGEKHTLKAKQIMNQGKSGSMHSTIPLISLKGCDSLAGSQMKSSAIYRL